LKPQILEDFVGQSHLLSPNSVLYKLIKSGDIPHMFFYGSPGSGKTSLANIIAKELNHDFYSFNATSFKVDDLRKVLDRYKSSLLKAIVFIDEIHRLSKTQQEVLLPHMESSSVIIIGASTENPYFSLTDAIRSRGFIYEFKPLEDKDLEKLLDRTNIALSKESREYLITSSSGDARSLLNLLNYAHKIDKDVTIETLRSLKNMPTKSGNKSDATHYDLASALIKSIRGSDVDASLYYLARIIDSGEPVEFITRRLVIFASEDIGNANPNALNLATSTMLSCSKIGYPESSIILSQCVVYLASSPKSNSSYKAIKEALNFTRSNPPLEIPNHIRDSAIGYKYPHEFGGWCEQNYLDRDLKFYDSQAIGFEKTLDEWLRKIKNEKLSDLD
jgi:putative ATPase